MSILNVNTIQPIGSGTTVTVAATELKTSNFITVGTGASVTSPSANVLTLGTNTAERLRITSAGSIGIGTDNPGTKLDVRGGNWSNGDIVVGQSGNAGRVKFRRGVDGSDSAFIGFAAADNNNRLSIGVDSGDGTIAFQTNSAERLRIDSSGDVGIGTDNPANVLDVQGSTHTKIHVGTTGTGHATGIQINHAKGNAALQEWQLQTDGSADGNLKIRNATSSTDVMFFDADNNNVGLNATSPERKLEVVDTNSNGSYPLAVSNFIDSTANKGAAIDFRMTTGGNTRGELGCKWTSNSSSDGTYFYIAPNDGSTGNIERLRITSSGHVLRPTMAAAAVTLSADQTTLSTFNTSYQSLSLNSEGYDNANNFNTSNYRFTAPETGFYQVGCNVQLESASGSNPNNWMYLYPIINGNAPGTVYGGNQADFDPTVSHYYNWTYTTLLKLSKNDYVEWKYRGNLSSVNLKGQGESIFYFYQVG